MGGRHFEGAKRGDADWTLEYLVDVFCGILLVEIWKVNYKSIIFVLPYYGHLSPYAALISKMDLFLNSKDTSLVGATQLTTDGGPRDACF